MATKFINSLIFDNGLLYLKNQSTRLYLIKQYTFGDSFSTVHNNRIGYCDIASTDFTISSNANNRRIVLNSNGKVATAEITVPAPDLHFAVTNSSNAVYWVTDETTDQPFIQNNIIAFPVSLTYTIIQP